MKRTAACWKWEGLQELEMALVGTPVSQLADVLAARVHRANESASPPSLAHPLVWRGDGFNPLWGKPQRDPITLPSPQHWHPWRRISQYFRWCLFPQHLLRLYLAPQEALHFWWGLQKGPPVPSHIPELALQTKAFSHVNLKGLDKSYLCGQCDKRISNLDSMVSNCLQEHLGVHLVCPHCGASYSNPSISITMAESTITCCFSNFNF